MIRLGAARAKYLSQQLAIGNCARMKLSPGIQYRTNGAKLKINV